MLVRAQPEDAATLEAFFSSSEQFTHGAAGCMIPLLSAKLLGQPLSCLCW